jgi:PAS domain S-box-containing protein
MGHFTFQGRLLLAFGATLVILACVGVLSYRRVLQEDADQKWVEHTHLVLEEVDSVLSDLLDQETGQRGYAITNDESFLHPYYAGRADLLHDLAGLRTLTADNPKQQAALAQLEVLVSFRQELFAESTKNSDAQKSREIAGKRFMDDIRAVLLGMKQEEQRLLVKRLEAAELSSRRMKLVIASGYVLSFFLLAFACLAIHNETAKRRSTEETLRNTQERYRLLFDSNPLPVWVYDLGNLEILDVSAAAVSHYGYARTEFLAFKITDLRPPEDVPVLLANVANAPGGELDSGPWRHKKKSGEIIDVEVKSYPLMFAGRKARLVVALDITERKRTEEALRQSEERFRLTVTNVRDYAIITLDPEGRVVSWNEGAQRIKGYTEEEILGQHFSRFYPAADVEAGKTENELEQATKDGHVEDEGWRVRKDGTRFWANVVITALRDESGRLRGFGKVTRDISERKRAEEEILRRSAELEAANQELESFSYSVSHDLRSPLRAIEGFSQALLEDNADQLDESGKGYFQRIRNATRRMGTLIDDLLNLARVTRAEMHREPIDLSALADELAADLRAGEPTRDVEFEITSGLRVEGDMHLVRAALQNLLENSWKFTSKRTHARIAFGTVRSNGQSAYFVRDNGAGFDQTHAQRLFGAFQRLHGMDEFPGTGIGLATVQRIVHRHGGKVWAEGVVDQGATIYFTL